MIFCNWSFENMRFERVVETFERLSKHLVDGGLFIIKGNWKPESKFKIADEIIEPLTAHRVRTP